MSGYVVCIGTSNVDVQGFVESSVMMQDKNPGGTIEVWVGGVARNVAENLARLGLSVKMLTAVGDDIFADKIIRDSSNAGIDMSHALILQNCRSGVYISITDADGDLAVGLTDMNITDRMTIDYFASKRAVLEGASIFVLSPEIPEIIDYLSLHYRQKPMFVDVTSKGYVAGLRPYLSAIHTVKANLPETEELADIPIETEEDIDRAADIMIDQGVQRMVITLGKDGVFYKDSDGVTLRKRTKEVTQVVNATGAGDALLAGVVYGFVNELDLDSTLSFAMSAAILTLNHKNTINQALSSKMVTQFMKESTV